MRHSLSGDDVLGGSLLALWKISRACSTSTCVAMLALDQSVYVRDTKNGDDRRQPVITLRAEQWLAFLDAAIGGESTIDCVGGEITAGGLTASRTVGGDVAFRCVESDTTLTFDDDEWRAFVVGARVGDFSVPDPSPKLPLALSS